jgi:hypothetical protein
VETAGLKRVATLQHYIVISQDEVDIRHFARLNNWAEHRSAVDAADLVLDKPTITLPIPEIYRGTGL